MEIIDSLIIKESDLEQRYNSIQNTFQEVILQMDDYHKKVILINCKKDFIGNRFSFLKKIKKINGYKIVDDLINDISNYFFLKDQFNQLLNDYHLTYNEEVNRQYSFLINFFCTPSFQKGLLQSSHSLFRQLQKLLDKEPKAFRKKERQTLKTLAKYFYRISTKTSPFSHFTTLDLLSNRNGTYLNNGVNQGQNIFQYNNFILAEMKNLLLTNISFYEQLNLSINPSLIFINDHFNFIRNIRNIETIQELECNEFLDIVINICKEKKVKYVEFVDELLEKVDSTREDIEAYLLGLIEIGFLEWDWNFSGLCFDWEEKLFDKVKTVNPFNNQKKWLECLEFMISSKKKLPHCSAEERGEIQQSLKVALDELGLNNSIIELIFFEDVQKKSSIVLQHKDIKPLIESLNHLLQNMKKYIVNDQEERIKKCWKEHFEKERTVPLITFYNCFYQESNNKNTILKINQKIENFKDVLMEFQEEDEEGNINFSTKNIFGDPLEDKLTAQYCGLFQFFNDKDSLNAVVTGLTSGYGKLYGRFLKLFNQEITQKIRKWNAEENYGLVENVDASIFNANFHPPLIAFEIRSSNSQNNLRRKNQIPINQLEVKWDENLEQPILVHRGNKKRIQVLDFGIEHPENRSPMYQLLNGFSPSFSTYKPFLKLVNDTYKNENEIKYLRRVTIDNHLILQRRSQIAPTTFFPKKEKNETASKFFFKIQKWKKKYSLPQYIFIKPVFQTGLSDLDQNRDFYKPQFIDLQSPIAIELLQKILNKSKGKIKIEEMLPNEQGMVGNSVAEFGVQWK